MDAFMLGLQTVFQPMSFLAIAFGVFWGVIGGIIPGINASVAMALLLPFTWGMDPTTAVMMLAGVYCGGEYGGSIPAILIGTPGTTAAACTVMDGYALHKKGKTGLALGTSLIASTFGGMFSAIVLVLVAIPLAKVALSFGPAEYFGLALLGLTLVCSLGGKNVFKGLLAGAVGVFIATIGFDPFAGVPRYTFGSYDLGAGLEMIPVMMGLFAVSELFVQVTEVHAGDTVIKSVKGDTRFPTWKEIRGLIPTMGLGSTIGVIIGAMPGVGATTAAFIAYSETKRWSKDKDSFGQGNPKGVAAPESANNGATGGALVPLLSLGIPGSNSTAIMLGALVIHNINPGPLLFTQHPEIPYGLFTSLFVSNFLMFFMGLLAIRIAIKVTSISKPVLVASIMALVFTGAFAFNLNIFDIGVTLFFGVAGFVMKKYGVPHTAVVLGFVLGFIMEVNFRRALIISHGDNLHAIFNSPLSTVLVVIAVVSVIATTVQNFRKPVEVEAAC
ncbi:MAG TPA: tripartite tricarboxylate transporter permease [Rectinemataceae bacterium]|nr:tripartite tricarboxylate transporter permease [Rectinemataceae bacterium]